MSSEQTEDLGSSAAPCPICREVADLPELKLARRKSDGSYGVRQTSVEAVVDEAPAISVNVGATGKISNSRIQAMTANPNRDNERGAERGSSSATTAGDGNVTAHIGRDRFLSAVSRSNTGEF